MDFKKPNTVIEWENFCSSIHDNINAVGKRDYTDGVNIPDGFIRYNRTNQTFEEYVLGSGFNPIDINFSSMTVTGSPTSDQSICGSDFYGDQFLRIHPDITGSSMFEGNACEMVLPGTSGHKKFRLIACVDWYAGESPYSGYFTLSFSPYDKYIYRQDFVRCGYRNGLKERDNDLDGSVNGFRVSKSFFPLMLVVDIIIYDPFTQSADVIIQGYCYKKSDPTNNSLTFYAQGRAICSTAYGFNAIKIEHFTNPSGEVRGHAILLQHPDE